MRIGVVSDIHGNLFALRAVVADMRHHDVTRVINRGDSLSGPLLPRETAEFLREQPWLHLAGNHERQILEAPETSDEYNSDSYARARLTPELLDWLRALRPVCEPEPNLLFCHGSPRSDLEYLLETASPSGFGLATPSEIAERLGTSQASLVLCGHSHLPRSVRLGKTLIVNPGSVGLPAYSARHPAPHVVETGSVDARYAIVERMGDRFRAELISVPYDFEDAVVLAERAGAHEWAHALRTGRALREPTPAVSSAARTTS
jgi:predicted phosphodiesterase